VAGERDPLPLARFRDPRCARSTEDIAKAVTGHYRAEHVFALTQALALYDTSTTQVQACDTEIAQHFQAIKPVWSDELPPLDRSVVGPSSSKNAPTYDAHSFLYPLTGVDVLTMPGLPASTAHTILAEIGLNMEQWPNEKAFCAW
jgi:transposase